MVISLPFVEKLTQRMLSCKEILDNALFKVKSIAYLTYVRPILEYASTVWSSYTKSDIAKLKMVQHKAALYVFNDFSSYSSVSSMLSQLN